MKRTDVQVFMLCNRNVPYLIDNEIITPLQCGTSVVDNNVCQLKDNTGNNISHLNEFYLENTGVYWIWKNINDAKYKGQMQYRRQFANLQYYDFDKIFQDHDIIVAEPLNLPSTFNDPKCTLEFHYKVAHNKRDLDVLEDIINEKYPEYQDDYIKYIKNGQNILYSCGFIMKSEDYDKYCQILFDIIEEYRKRMNLHNILDVKNYVINCYKNNKRSKLLPLSAVDLFLLSVRRVDRKTVAIPVSPIWTNNCALTLIGVRAYTESVFAIKRRLECFLLP